MRRLASTRFRVTQSTAPIRPSIAQYAQTREYNGDPGPSTARRQSFNNNDRPGASFNRDGPSRARPSSPSGESRESRPRYGQGTTGQSSDSGNSRPARPDFTNRRPDSRPSRDFRTSRPGSPNDRPRGPTSPTGFVKPKGWTPEKALNNSKGFQARISQKNPSSLSFIRNQSPSSSSSSSRRPVDPSAQSPRHTWRRGHINVPPISDKPTEHRLDPYETSGRITKWIKEHPSPIQHREVDELLRMVMDAPRYRVNTVVWNQVLSVLGRENRLANMYRALNFMKKRGYKPNSRTYVIMLNAYAGARHMGDEVNFNPGDRPQEKIWQRVLTIYNESQAHISRCITQINKAKDKSAAKKTDEDLGLEGDVTLVEEGKPKVEHTPLAQLQEEVNVTPTNAYLKLLARYGMWDQMDKVHLAMDKSGPLSPDTRTYTILFSSLLNRWAQQTDGRYASAKDKLSTLMTIDQFGNTAKAMWDEAVRRFHPSVPPEGSKKDDARRIDEEVAMLGMKALLTGRPSDQLLATKLIPFIWAMPSPETPAPASMTGNTSTKAIRDGSDVPHYMQGIPAIPISIRSATAILQMLGKANKLTQAARHARYFWSLPELRKEVDYGFIRSIMHALGSDGDIDLIKDIMRQYQPPTGKEGWQSYIWENALIATRQKSDFDSALEMFRRMTHLPMGVEDGLGAKDRKAYVWKRPGHQDIKGNNFLQPESQPPTAKAMSLLYKAAFSPGSGGASERNVRKAFNVFSAFPLETFFVIPGTEFRRGKDINLLAEDGDQYEGEIHSSLVFAAEWRMLLAKDVEKATNYILEQATPEEKQPLETLRARMRKITETWGGVLHSKAATKSAGPIRPTKDGATIMPRPQTQSSGLPLRQNPIDPEIDESEFDEGELAGLSDEEFERRLEEEMLFDEEEMRSGFGGGQRRWGG